MKRTVILLALFLTACIGIPTLPPPITATPEPTLTPILPTKTATPVPTQIHTVSIRAVVYVRQLADTDSPVTGSLETGQVVEIVGCAGNWCELMDPPGFVWRGCTNNNPKKLGCAVR